MNPVVAIVPWGDVIEDYLGSIGLTVEEFARDMSGGWLFGYVQALLSAGFSPFILAPSSSVDKPSKLTHADTGVGIWLVPGRSCQPIGNLELRSVCQWLSMPRGATRQVLRQEGCQYLLVQDYERPQFDSLVNLGRSLEIPVFATFQGGDRTLSRIERLVRRQSIRRAAGLVIAASAERTRVAAAYDLQAERIAAVPNPVDLEVWTPMPRAQARASLEISSQEFVAVTHGRIDIHRKGLDLLLAGWAGLGMLVLIGSGQDRARLTTMVKDRTDVRWIDHYTNDRELIRRWLSAADLYVSASRLEGMPVAPLEAMACGLPVVASTAKGLEDIFPPDLPSGGIRFPTGDVDALSSAIRELRDDPALRQRLGLHARKAAELRFSINSVGERLGLLLRSQGLAKSS